MNRVVSCVGTILALAALLACCKPQRGDSASAPTSRGKQLIEHAKWLSIEQLPDYTKVDIVNPWDSTAVLGRYVLVHRGEQPDSLPQGYLRLEVPLERSIVYSSVHTGVLSELDALASLAGVADGGYIKNVRVADLIAGGAVADVGSSSAPSLEKIAALQPDAILLSPFENAGHGALDALGIPLVECADYMESTPLGRAEWIKLFGALYDRQAEADSVFRIVKHTYNELSQAAAECKEHPVVLTERLSGGYWFVPGGESYMARIIEDAGGRYPWRANKSAGSLQLDFSAVYAHAADADVWLIRTYGDDLTLEGLRSEYPLNSQFKAYKHRRVYVADTSRVPLFDEFPFHPERLLAEYAAIFHGENRFGGLRYYKKIN